jgi:hypothetical protein
MRLFLVNSLHLDDAVFDAVGLATLTRLMGGNAGLTVEPIDDPTDDDYAALMEWDDEAQAFM